MAVLEELKKSTERVTGWQRPAAERVPALIRNTKPATFRFRDDGAIPNHPRWPVLVYWRAVRLPYGDGALAMTIVIPDSGRELLDGGPDADTLEVMLNARGTGGHIRIELLTDDPLIGDIARRPSVELERLRPPSGPSAQGPPRLFPAVCGRRPRLAASRARPLARLCRRFPAAPHAPARLRRVIETGSPGSPGA